MGWIRCVHYEKLWRDFVARTSPLIALVQLVLHRVSCSNETNPKCTQTVWKKPILEFRVQLGGSSAFFAKNSDATLWHQFNLFCTEFHVVTKHSQMHPNTMKTHQNMSLGSNGVDRVRLLPKIPMRVRGMTFCINSTSSAYSHRVSCNNETIQNAPKHYKTHQFMSLASNGVDRVRSLQKTLMRFRGTNFFFNCTSSTCFAPSFVQ